MLSLCWDTEGGLRIEGSSREHKDLIKKCGYRWAPSRGLWVVPNTRGSEKPSRNMFREKKRIEAILGFEIDLRVVYPQNMEEVLESKEKILEQKIAKLEDNIETNKGKPSQLFESSMRIIGEIVPGQPILKDHYSCKKHMRALERHDNLMRKGIACEKVLESKTEKVETLKRELEKVKKRTNIEQIKEEIEGYVRCLKALKKELNISRIKQSYKHETKHKIDVYYRIEIMRKNIKEIIMLVFNQGGIYFNFNEDSKNKSFTYNEMPIFEFEKCLKEVFNYGNDSLTFENVSIF